MEEQARGRIQKRHAVDQEDQHERANQPVAMARDEWQTIPNDDQRTDAAERQQHLGFVDLQTEKKDARHGRSDDQPRGVRRGALARWRRKHECVRSRHLHHYNLTAQAVGTGGSGCCISISSHALRPFPMRATVVPSRRRVKTSHPTLFLPK